MCEGVVTGGQHVPYKTYSKDFIYEIEDVASEAASSAAAAATPFVSEATAVAMAFQ